MKRTAIALLTLLIFVLPAGAELARSGNFVVDLDSYTPPAEGGILNGDRAVNVLLNPGFEDGVLPPWTTDNWWISTVNPHTGQFCSEDEGNFSIQQDFAPVDVNDVLEVSMWSMQPEGIAFQAVVLYYGPADSDQFLVAPGADWTYIDMTSQLRGAGSLQGIQIYGYSSDGEGDLTRCDDVLVDTNLVTPTDNANWSVVKSLY